jgi:hypothetical protein
MAAPQPQAQRDTGLTIPFVTEMKFEVGVIEQVAPRVRRVIAGNPGPFTFHGTGTYIIGRGEVAVIDPGPAIEAHVDALLAALAGETVTLWLGLDDDHLFVEHGERRFGPYAPLGGPIPLHRYRSFKKTRTQKRADRIEGLAEQLSLPRAALSDDPTLAASLSTVEVAKQPFSDPDPFHELAFPSALDAKRAIADHLGMP